MEAALASGDVDAVRRLLSGGKAAELHVAPSNLLFQGRHWLHLPLADGLVTIQLLQYRVMGKVVWPGEPFLESSPNARRSVLSQK